MSPWLIGILVGCCGGTVAALCGVGGGIILVPVFAKIFGWSMKSAVAASLLVVLPTVLSATAGNLRGGLPDWKVVDWRILAATALASSVMAFFAAGWLKNFSNDQLNTIFGILMIVVGIQTIWGK